MPKIIGKSQTVVDHDGLKIDELAGNVATNSDTISVGLVTISKPTSEPWLTLEYDEWMCVTKGHVSLHYEEKGKGVADEGTVTHEKVLEVKCGETVFIQKGERFRPVFPSAQTEYIPVCLPAFRPDRCHREEEIDFGDVSATLNKLHQTSNRTTNISNADVTDVTAKSPPSQINNQTISDIIYHMCQKKQWEEADKSGSAYFPSTFEKDGQFTHAMAIPERLIKTANHFYTQTDGDWICLEMSRLALLKVGIITKDEGPLPVGQTAVSTNLISSQWTCPHIYGGIPTLESLAVVTDIYDMSRDEHGTFLNIVGLTD